MEPTAHIEEHANFEDDPPFSHAKFGYVSVVFIYLMYQFAGQMLHSLVKPIESDGVMALTQGVGQALFMLVPALFVMQYSPLKVSGLMRSEGTVTVGQWLLGITGIVGVQVFAAGFVVVQDRLIPDFLYPLYTKLTMLSEMMESVYRSILGGSSGLDAARALVIGAVIPAFSEEILFRGVLQRSLEEVRSPKRAIIVTACIFGLLHFNPISVLPLMAVGAYLGFLAYYTQSLALPIVAHFFNNAFAIVALYIPSNHFNESEALHLPVWQALVFTMFGLGMLLFAVGVIVTRTPQAPKDERNENDITLDNTEEHNI